LLDEEVAKQGEVFKGRRVGRENYLPLFPIFTLLLIFISQGGRSFLAPRPRGCTGSTLKLPPLLLCLLPFVGDTIGLPPCHILRQGDPLWGAVCVPKNLDKNVYVLKKRKLTPTNKTELECTHPRAGDPFP
jgi:hypothetical protein